MFVVEVVQRMNGWLHVPARGALKQADGSYDTLIIKKSRIQRGRWL
jgi:hypothetical protein